MSIMLRGAVAGVTSALLTGALGGVVLGTTTASEGGTIHTASSVPTARTPGKITICVKKSNGRMRLPKSGKKCRRTERKMTWPLRPSPSLVYQASSTATVPIGAAMTTIVDLPVTAGDYLVSASTTLETTYLNLGPGAKQCMLADSDGVAYTPAPLWNLSGSVGVGQMNTATITYALTVPHVPGASVQLMCAWAGGGMQTTGTSVITATQVASIR